MCPEKIKPKKETASPSETASKEEVSHEELAEWSGENTVRRFKFKVPILKFNGNTGKFSLLTPDEAGNWLSEDIAKSQIDVVVLKVRRILSSYEKQPDGSGLRTFTNEHNNWKDRLTVFEMGKGDSKPRMLDSGSSETVRENFPKLRLRQNLYCLYNDQVVKLTARGKSLSSLFNFYAEFQGQDEHIYQFNTKLSCHEETNEGGLTYFVMDWERGKEVDLPMVAGKIKEVKEKIDQQDKQFSDRAVPDIDKAVEGPEEKLEEESVDSSEKDKDEMIEVSDIPA